MKGDGNDQHCNVEDKSTNRRTMAEHFQDFSVNFGMPENINSLHDSCERTVQDSAKWNEQTELNLQKVDGSLYRSLDQSRPFIVLQSNISWR